MPPARRRATAAAASTLLDPAAEPHTPHTLRAQGRPYMLALAMVLSAVCALLGLTAAAPAAAKPNIVLFLTVRALLSLIAHGKILQGNFVGGWGCICRMTRTKCWARHSRASPKGVQLPCQRQCTRWRRVAPWPQISSYTRRSAVPLARN